MTDASRTTPQSAETLAPVFSAARIAELLAVPPKPTITPTSEQRGVIEHPLSGSTLVVAGAGSGKTETMANRVVWLVANGLVAPDHVLGLTFTRKAAGELRERITGRLLTFVERLADAASLGKLSEAELIRANELEALLGDGLDLPEVSTYNAFAAGVLQEFGAAAGLAPGAAIIDEATAWRIAREVMVGSTDPALVTSELSIPALTEKVIEMDHAVSDHLSSLERVDAIVAEFARVTSLPYDRKERDRGGEPSGKVYAPVRDAVAALSENPLITRLAREYAAEKQRRGVLEFSDQLALATLALERSADAVAVLRARHRAVLLDEVQDTSVGQTRFLSRIFAGGSVMAVGDPHQSIYGWRGASAAGLSSFHRDFRGRRGSAGSDAEARQAAPSVGEGGSTLTLSTSWRNPESVLAAANVIAVPLAAESPIAVPELGPRPGAGAGSVDWRYPETIHEERIAVAEWMRDARESHLAATGEQATAAVIFRNRRHMAAFASALADVGVPARIVGVGGLLTTPEVTDIVSTLRCLWYADAGSALIRVLAGPRFRIGAADLAGLNRARRWFAERDTAMQPLTPEDRAADAVLPDPDREVTLVDALDRIAQLRDLDHGALREISPVGRERLREAGRLLAALRQLVGGEITELISAVVQALRIDIELDANERSPLAGTSNAHANVDRFLELVEGQLAIDERGTLASILEWIERSTEGDQVAEHVPEPVPGTVQLITAHGSKGLEWDLVAVPRLVTGEFPSTPKEGGGWLRTGQLPDELRGDAAARPRLDWRIADTQQELKERIAEYRAALKERFAEEERRLAYVAVTRAADRLLLTGSFWGGQTRQRTPSPYLTELAERGLISGLPEASEFESDPSALEEERLVWPLDPLGTRAAAVEAAAERLRAALEEQADTPGPSESLPADVDESIALLIAERRAALAPSRGDEEVALPERITASTFHEFVDDPERAERNRLRPIPQRPYRRTRVGNRFHEWVERRATTAAGRALPLAGLDELDRSPELDTEAELQPLIEVFERSRWAGLAPIAVEQEVTLPFAGRTLVCKLDAVYRVEGTDRLEVVDWKAGRSPRTDAERESRFFQLDLYRHAYAAWAGIDPERIDVTLFYVAEGVELSGNTSRTLAELERIWIEAAGGMRESAAGSGPDRGTRTESR
ncbi:ATP-dependent helicase [Leucobacter sp. CSA2]|uniref:DNA 3'-5' helicase n=1 Tax=Leucobacter edaphi TaxID=2796472 RepID=A0A934QA69_9MICO|nr:ATP-dependent DNA helicase [Leucobacter edaphi]MBK0421005.1 ATP-dependent helicase [Leucobacter edaphi]